MTITYAFFRGRKSHNKGRLSKVHAYHSNSSKIYALCGLFMSSNEHNKIGIELEDVNYTGDLCLNCTYHLNKLGINWYAIIRGIKITKKSPTHVADNRGDSLDINLNVNTTSEMTDIISYVLHDHKLVVITINGEFDSAKISSDCDKHFTTISSDQSLLRLFTVVYTALEKLDLLSDELVQNMEQFLFENKNK